MTSESTRMLKGVPHGLQAHTLMPAVRSIPSLLFDHSYADNVASTSFGPMKCPVSENAQGQSMSDKKAGRANFNSRAA